MSHNPKVNGISEFFSKPRLVPMPEILRELILEGAKVDYMGLKGKSVERRVIDARAPEIAEGLVGSIRGHVVPALTDGRVYHVYHPNTGRYIGSTVSKLG